MYTKIEELCGERFWTEAFIRNAERELETVLSDSNRAFVEGYIARQRQHLADVNARLLAAQEQQAAAVQKGDAQWKNSTH